MINPRTLTSLFVSAMLTSSFIPSASNPVLASPVDAVFGRAALESAMEGMRSEGFRAPAPREWPAAPSPSRTVAVEPATAPIEEPPLSEAAFQHLKNLAVARAKVTEYNGTIAKLLGLAQGEPFPTVQYGYDKNGVRHSFIVSVKDHKDVMIAHKTTDTITVILTDSTRTIRAAAIYVVDTEPRLATTAEVEAIFKAELQYWAAKEVEFTAAGK